MALTDKGIERARVKPRSYVLSDAPLTIGLQLKVTASGRRIFQLQSVYPNSSVQTRRTLGLWPAMSLPQAREKAREWHSLIRNGVDPAVAEEAKARAAAADRRAQAEADAQTLAAVLRRY